MYAGNVSFSYIDMAFQLGRRKNRRLSWATMNGRAEAEAWVRGAKRIIHNQTFIQLLAVLAITVPLPLTAFVFLSVFGFSSPIVIQSIVALWATVTTSYAALLIYTRIKQR